MREREPVRWFCQMGAAMVLTGLAILGQGGTTLQAADEGGTFAPELAMTITLEDGVSTPVQVALSGRHQKPIQTWKDVAPGEVRRQFPKLEPRAILA